MDGSTRPSSLSRVPWPEHRRTPSPWPTWPRCSSAAGVWPTRLDALERAEAVAGTTAFTARIPGDLRYRERRWREAARCYADADVLGDRGTWSLVQLARCHLRLDELEAARGLRRERWSGTRPTRPPWSSWARWRCATAVRTTPSTTSSGPTSARTGRRVAYAKLIEARVLRLAPEDREREVEVLLRSHDQGNRHLLGVLARLRTQGGDDRQAAETWGARRKLHGDPYARKMEAYALRKAGDLEQAAVLFRPAFSRTPRT